VPASRCRSDRPRRYVSLPATTRTERTEAAILKDTRELLAEGGVAGLTIEGVAARSGVAKTTIYRRWRDKDELALAVLIDSTESVRPPLDVGDTRKELLTFITTATRIITENGVAAGLTSEIATRPELAHTYQERVVEVRLREVGEVVARGIERGDPAGHERTGPSRDARRAAVLPAAAQRRPAEPPPRKRGR
jgi:AcrR family transcriptional regulator